VLKRLTLNVSRSQSNQATSHHISTSGIAFIAGAVGAAINAALVLVLAPSGADADGGFAVAAPSGGLRRGTQACSYMRPSHMVIVVID
jgi:hypothetical protein